MREAIEKALEEFGACKEMAAGRTLGTSELLPFLDAHPGAGPLFEPVADDVNVDAQGRSRKQAFIDEMRQVDPARAVGPDPSPAERELVTEYANRLGDLVEAQVGQEVGQLVEGLRARFGGDVSWTIRTKDEDGILDKVGRMSQDRPYYRVGDVIDAVGARITVDDTHQLAALYRDVKERFGVADGGRILEIENMYASPKAAYPSYRVIPLVVTVERSSHLYTFELQLTTRRASIGADLQHNTLHKSIVETTADERAAILRAWEESAALEQVETTRRG